MYLRNHSCAGFVTASTLIIITMLTKPFCQFMFYRKLTQTNYILMAIRLHSFFKTSYVHVAAETLTC